MSVTAAQLQLLQSVALRWKGYKVTLAHAQQGIRQKTLPFQELLLKVVNLEDRIEEVAAISLPSSFGVKPPDATTQRSKPPGSPHSRQSSMNLGVPKPLSYSQCRHLHELVSFLKANPRTLAKALHSSSLDALEADELCKAIVNDIFRDPQDLGALLEFCHQVLSDVFSSLSKTHPSASGSAFLVPNSLSSSLIQHVLNRFGRDYLILILEPTITFVLQNDQLELEFSSGPSSPSEKEAKSAEADHQDLLDICDQCLQRIITTLPNIPPFIRRFAACLSSIAVSEPENTDISDFLFMHWLVNAFWNPGILANVCPISSVGRSNLEAVGTVFLKLMSNSQFSSFDDNLASINSFLANWQPKMLSFLHAIVDLSHVESLESSTSDIGLAIQPLLLKPRDIAHLLKVLDSFASDIPGEEELPTLLRNCGPLHCEYIVEMDRYIDLFLGVPDFSTDSKLFAHDARKQHIANRMVQILTTIRRLPSVPDQASALEVLEEEAQRCAEVGLFSQAAILTESQRFIASSLSPELLEELMCALKACIELLEGKEGGQALQMMLLDQRLNNFADDLKTRESFCLSLLKMGRVREILEHLSPRLRYFAGQLRIRYGKMKRYACTGMPDVEKEVFVCRRCALMTQKQLEALEIAVGDCIRVYESSHIPSTVCNSEAMERLGLSEKQKKDLSLSRSFMHRELLEFLLVTSFDSVFIHCAREDTRFRQRMLRLADCFPRYVDFQECLSKDGTEQSDFSPLDLSESSIQMAASQLDSLAQNRSLQGQIKALSKCREVLISILSTFSGSGADDYMPLLCYTVMKSKSLHLLSSLTFLRVLHPSCTTVKAFVDISAAVHFLINLPSPSLPESLPPALDAFVQELLDAGHSTKEICLAFDHLLVDIAADKVDSNVNVFLEGLRTLLAKGYPQQQSIHALTLSHFNLEKCDKLLAALKNNAP